MIDAGEQCTDVIRVHRGERRDAQLVAAQLPVRLDVDDAIGAQHGCQARCVDRFVEVDGADDLRTVGRVGDVGTGDRGGLGPCVDEGG